MDETPTLQPVLKAERFDRVAVLTVCNPPVNALSQALRTSTLDQVMSLSNDNRVDAIVIIGDKGSFIAGADMREFEGPLLTPSLPEVLDVIERSEKPVVAAIGNVALGGGAELALACHLRVATPDSKLGFPEVKLGIIPGAGGIPRLIRLVEASTALDLVASGRLINGRRANELGLIDHLAEQEALLPTAIEHAKKAAASGFRRTSAREVRAYDRSALRGSAARLSARAKGQDSVTKAIDALEISLNAQYSDAVAACRDIFLTLRDSDQARALRHLFFAEREAQKIPGIGMRDGRPINSVAVVGAGTMGQGIAAACIRAGYPTLVLDKSAELVAKASSAIFESVAKSATSEAWPTERVFSTIERLSTGTTLDAITDRDLIIEAVFEDMEIKRYVVAQITERCSDEAIIATNTSYLDTNVLARASADPSKFLGLHFFAPAEVMRLVEVVRSDTTDNATLATMVKFARSLGKLPIISGVCDGFIVNRILAAYRTQMEYLLEDGCLPYQVDEALERFGMAMGPFAVADLSGLDIGWSRRKRLAPTRDPNERYVKIADQLCEMGRFGRKAGAGWYDYRAGTRRPDPIVESIVLAASSASGITRRDINSDEIVGRALNAMTGEAIKILDEGIALRASDIDLAIVNGLGFPAWRGGPLYAQKREKPELTQRNQRR